MVLCVEYIWIDKHGAYRSKCKVFQHQNISLKDLPAWNFDWSSTKQSTSKYNTEVVIRPAALFNDPFRGGNHKLVLCDCYDTDGKPHLTNSRYYAQHDVFSKKKKIGSLVWNGTRIFYSRSSHQITFGLSSR